MNIKLTILNSFFFISLITVLLFNRLLAQYYIVGYYLYLIIVTIPLFILQFISISIFSTRIKKKAPNIFSQACKRPNGSRGRSINVSALFDESIPFSEMKEQHLIRDWNFAKRVVIYSMISFIILIILFFI